MKNEKHGGVNIAGYQPMTLLDYPGKLATIVFTQGCNFRCSYCQNSELLKMSSMNDNYRSRIIEFLSYLKERSGKLEGVVISGGEPCIQPDIISFISLIKSFGYLIKLDTNGSKPDVLKYLIKEKMIDYIAMDIKGTYFKYDIISGDKPTLVGDRTIQSFWYDSIKESTQIIANSNIEYEFRTTCVHPLLQEYDFHIIGRLFEGAKKYYLQNYVKSENVYSPDGLESFTRKELENAKDILSKYMDEVEIRGEY